MKNNYNEVFKSFLAKIEKENNKPSLLLHACCGPCLTYPLSILVKYFNVTVAYINPNIYPQEEYDLRLSELRRFVDEYNKDNNLDVKVIAFDADYAKYLSFVKGYENDKEGGERCLLCHRLRLEMAYDYAEENSFDFFTTVMTVSSKKPSAIINELCLGLEKEKNYTTRYLPSDFKKEEGQLKGIIIAKKYGLYRQNYCGCSFSLIERKKQIN